MKNDELYESLRSKLKKKVSKHRYEHSVSVGDWAAQLGKKHGWNPNRARLAGLLHDYVKEWSPKKLRRYAIKRRLSVPDKKFIIETAPNMLHAYVGADVVRRKKWITNKKDLSAMASHTLGNEKMSLEDKILFIADFSEPLRPYKASAAAIRKIALKNLDAGFREAVAHKIGWQLKKCKPIHPTPFRVWNRVVCRVTS